MRTSLLSALTWALTIPAVLTAPTPTTEPKALTPRESAIASRASAGVSSAVPSVHPIVQARGIPPRGKRRKSPPEKYFHESSFHPHYDGRFATKEVPYADRKIALVNLIKSYLNTMNEIGVQTWIMHGSLLGWWWNKRIMPWDTDLDVMVSEQAMEHLANYYNMTIHHHRYDDGALGRDYMLEINPHFRNTSEADRYNRIDARWVDVKTGLFIDMTVLHRNISAENEGKVGAMMSKDRHHYHIKDIFPLRETVFEDVPCLVPYGYTDLLIEEYGPMSLIKRDFANHHFDQLTMEWLPVVNPKKENTHGDTKEEAEKKKAEAAKKSAELKKAEDEKKKQEEERKKLGGSQQKLEGDALQKHEEEGKKQQEEKKKLEEDEKKKHEEESKKQQEEKKKTEEDEKKKQDEAAKKQQEEKKKAEDEEIKKLKERKRLEEVEQSKLDEEKKKLDEEKQKLDEEKKKHEEVAKKLQEKAGAAVENKPQENKSARQSAA